MLTEQKKQEIRDRLRYQDSIFRKLRQSTTPTPQFQKPQIEKPQPKESSKTKNPHIINTSERLNTMRKILFYCCLAVIAAMCIFPPWKETRLNYNKIKVDVPAGYSPIWFPPNFEIAEKTYNAFDIAEKIYASEKPLVSLPEGFELVKSPEMNDAGKRVRTVAAYSIDFDRLALQMIPVIMLAAILRFYARII